MSSISLPYDDWCAFTSVHLSDRNKLLLSGGCDCTTLDSYTDRSSRVGHAALVDLSTGTSIAVSNKPTQTWSHAAVYHDGKVYTIGGSTTHNVWTANVDVYDADDGTWSTVASASYPVAIGELQCTMHGSKIICAGGYRFSFSSSAYVMDLDSSDPSWSALPSLSSGRIYHGLVATDSFVYAMAGYCGHYCYTSKVEVLDMSDPTSWSASSASIPDYRLSAMYTSANGKLYVISGVTPTNAATHARKINRSYLTADTGAVISSWVTASLDLSERECTGCCCGGRLSSMDMAYVSDSTGVTALAPDSASSIELRTVACPLTLPPSGAASLAELTLPTLTHWFDFSRLSESNIDSLVSSNVVDLKGNATSIEVVGTVAFETNVQNGLGAVYFDEPGVSRTLRFRSTLLGRNPEIFVVYRVMKYSANGVIIGDVGNGYGFGTYKTADGFVGVWRSSGALMVKVAAEYSSWHLAHLYFGENDNDGFLQIDSGERHYFGISGKYRTSSHSRPEMGAFSGDSFDHMVEQYVGEVAYFSAALSEERRTDVTNALMTKWNLPCSWKDLGGVGDFTVGQPGHTVSVVGSLAECKSLCETRTCKVIHFCDAGSGSRQGECWMADQTSEVANSAGCADVKNYERTCG